MNELRWILLVAGVMLIAGLYLWGMRSRWQGRGESEASRRPAVFTGGAQGFESAAASPLVDDADAHADDTGPPEFRVEARAERRIEPSFDGDSVDDLDPAASSRVDFDDEGDFETPAIGRREPTLSATRSETATTSRLEPTLRVEPTFDARVVEASESPPHAAPDEALVPRRAQKILALRVTASAPARFDGAQLLKALGEEGLAYGRYEIFHRLHDDGRPIYSVASLREPGTFDIETMPTTYYPGVAMFAVLPGPVSAADAFDEMIFAARALATHLDGSLADERGAPLTALRVGKLREEALEFERTTGSS